MQILRSCSAGQHKIRVHSRPDIRCCQRRLTSSAALLGAALEPKQSRLSRPCNCNSSSALPSKGKEPSKNSSLVVPHAIHHGHVGLQMARGCQARPTPGRFKPNKFDRVTYMPSTRSWPSRPLFHSPCSVHISGKHRMGGTSHLSRSDQL